MNRRYQITTDEKLPDSKLVEYTLILCALKDGKISLPEAYNISAFGWILKGHCPGFGANILGKYGSILAESNFTHNYEKQALFSINL